jgi:RNA polymerase sigma-70 factor (ECF subfamily)
MDLSDETVLEMQSALDSANRGDQVAFAELLGRFETRFRDLARRMLSSYPKLRRWEQTDDIFQQSMVRLHRSLAGAMPASVSEFVGLSATQIRRTLIDLGRHYFGPHGWGQQHQTEGGGRAADDAGGAVERSRGQQTSFSLEEWTEFHEAIEGLPQEARQTFELIWYAGLRQTEAADLLNISRRTLIRRLNLARRLLSETLK